MKNDRFFGKKINGMRIKLICVAVFLALLALILLLVTFLPRQDPVEVYALSSRPARYRALRVKQAMVVQNMTLHGTCTGCEIEATPPVTTSITPGDLLFTATYTEGASAIVVNPATYDKTTIHALGCSAVSDEGDFLLCHGAVSGGVGYLKPYHPLTPTLWYEAGAWISYWVVME